MPIDPNAIGATTEPQTLRPGPTATPCSMRSASAPALDDLAFTTENSHDIHAAGAADLRGHRLLAVRRGRPRSAGSTSACCCTARRRSGCYTPLPPAGKLSVVAEVADIQDKGEGKNAVVMLKATGTDPDTGEVVAETLTTAGDPR